MYCICLTTPLSNKKKIRVKRRKIWKITKFSLFLYT